MPNIILTSSFNAVAQELFVRNLIPRAPVRVAFIATAGNIYKNTPWITKDRNALTDLGYALVELDLVGKNAEQLKSDLAPCDIIFVAGGNTSYLCEYAHISGLHLIIRDLLSGGRMYIGSSAGSILAGPSVEPFLEEDSKELPQDFILHDPCGLRLVEYVTLPHYPNFAKENDAIAKKYLHQFTFVPLTDTEYRADS